MSSSSQDGTGLATQFWGCRDYWRGCHCTRSVTPMLLCSRLPLHLSKVFSFPMKVLPFLAKESPRCLIIPETAFYFGLCPCLVAALCLPLGWLWICVCRTQAQPLGCGLCSSFRNSFKLHGCKKMGAAPSQPHGGLNGVSAPGAAPDQRWTEAERHSPVSAVSQLGRLPEAHPSSLPSGGFQQGGAPGVHLFGGAFPSPTHFSPHPWWFPWGHLPDALFSFPASGVLWGESS